MATWGSETGISIKGGAPPPLGEAAERRGEANAS
jgi:hypothetical protein